MRFVYSAVIAATTLALAFGASAQEEFDLDKLLEDLAVEDSAATNAVEDAPLKGEEPAAGAVEGVRRSR